jgi:hypothetical protein
VKYLKEKRKQQLIILYPGSLSFKNGREIRTLSDKQKLKEFE